MQLVKWESALRFGVLELHHIGAQTVYFEYTGGKPNHPCQKGGILNGEREKWEQEVKTYILPSVVILL